MISLVKKLYANDVVRYVFFGGCTTVVNLASFFILRQAGVQREVANVISIILAILFAYVVNSKFVLQDKCETLKDHIQPSLKFLERQTYHHGHRGWRSVVLRRNRTYKRYGGETDHPVCSYGIKLRIQQIPGIYQWEEMMTLEEALKKINPLTRKRWRLPGSDGTALQSLFIPLEKWKT